MFDAIRRFALALVAFTLPIQGFSWLDFEELRATPFKTATAFLLLVGFLQFGLTARRRPPDRKTVWMIVFLVSYSISWVVGLVKGEHIAVLIVLASTYVSLIAYYFLIGYMVLSRRDLVLVLWALVLGGLISAAPPVLGLEAARSGRATGLAGQSNQLGSDMAVCLPIAAGMLVAHRGLFGKLVLGSSALFAAGGILLSLSRTAFVSVLAMWGMWTVRFRRLDTLKYAIPVALALGALALYLPQTVQERIETMTDPIQRARDGSIQSRFVIGRYAIGAFLASPLVGQGEGTSFNKWAWQQRGGRAVSDATIHNAYLHVAAIQGLLGLIPFLAIYGLTWTDYNRAWRAARRHPARDPDLLSLGHYAIFLQIAFLGTILAGFFGQQQRSKTMWLLLALSPVLVRLVRERIGELERGAAPLAEAAASESELITLSPGRLNPVPR
jgi:O-antigen ligase